jgi:YfiH family protein
MTGARGFSFSRLGSGREIGTFRRLSRIPGIVHAVTTKDGPLFSKDAADSRGYDDLARDVGFESVAWTNQVHSGRVLHVDRPGCAGDADGLVTREEGLLLLARGADCPLIIAADMSGGAVGVAHVSWRGLLDGGAENLVRAMETECDCDPADLAACISPSAGPERYEVGRDVYDAAIDALGENAGYFFINRPDTPETGRRFFDLWEACASRLIGAGMDFMNVSMARICTIENNDRFPSYRAEGEVAGRFAAVAGIK